MDNQDETHQLLEGEVGVRQSSTYGTQGRASETGWPPSTPQVTWLPVAVAALTAFLVNCQPSEPYLTQYLEDVKNLTESQLDNVVWPADTYSTLVAVIPIALLAEAVGYATVIGLGLVCRESTRLLLLFGKGLPLMATMQVTYAVASVANAVLFSYAYLYIPRRHFAKAALLVRGAYHLGNFIGSGLGELLVRHVQAFQGLTGLFYVSFGMTTCGVLVFVTGHALLRCRHTREQEQQQERAVQPMSRASMQGHGLCAALRQEGGLGAVFKQTFGALNVIATTWFLWLVFAYGANLLLGNYFQTLLHRWYGSLQFGLIECLLELGSGLGSVCMVFLLKHLQGGRGKAAASALVSLGVCSTLAGLLQVRWGAWGVSVALHALLMMAYNSFVALAQAELSSHLQGHAFALVTLGANMCSLLLVTVCSAVASGLEQHAPTYYAIMLAMFVCGFCAVLLQTSRVFTWLCTCCCSHEHAVGFITRENSYGVDGDNHHGDDADGDQGERHPGSDKQRRTDKPKEAAHRSHTNASLGGHRADTSVQALI
eukprot:m.359311 g.359311  ORF g.359311 m.359311 type:complete len:541 (+) comp18529_c0_seq1:299-1921(+)